MKAPSKSAVHYGLLPLGLSLAVLLLDSLAALGRGWRPNGSIENAILMLIFLAALALLLACAIPHLRRWTCAWTRELSLFCLITLLSLAALEFAAHHLEAAMRRDPFFHTRGPKLQQTFTPNPADITGITHPATYTTDEAGRRRCPTLNSAPAPRLLCVGGSTTECVYLDDCATWPALLATALTVGPQKRPAWVGSVGVSGFDTRDHLRFLRQSPLPDTVDILLFQTGINDLWRYLAGEEQAIDYNRFAATNLPPQTIAAAPRPLWSRANLIQFYHTFRSRRAQPPAPEAHTVEGAGGAEYRIRRQRRSEAEITDALPELTPGLQSYRRRLEALIAGCKKKRLRPVFLSQPVLWRADLPPDLAARCWFGWLEDGRYLSLSALRRAMDAYNTVGAQACQQARVPWIDLSALQGNGAFFYDDCHFTEAGAQAVAEAAAPMLQQIIAHLH